jgi:glycosyltransferase involved in cell wall biosynthesis
VIEDEIQVLLATYNGERYLRQQLDSILTQDYVDLRILARDDGSNDNTAAILAEYASNLPERIQVLATDAPSGSPKGNFQRLMEASTAPYIMFSDQDDVWDADKASVSMERMRRLEGEHGVGAPLLVFTDLTVVSADLKVLNHSFWRHQNIHPSAIHRLTWLLRHNAMPGCSALFNRPLLDLAVPIPDEAHMHDWWIALVANILGYSSYLDRSTVRYRQHARNSIGAGKEQHASRLPFVYDREIRTKTGGWSEPQAQALLRLHGPIMPVRKKVIVETFLRWRALRSGMGRLTKMLRRVSPSEAEVS